MNDIMRLDKQTILQRVASGALDPDRAVALLAALAGADHAGPASAAGDGAELDLFFWEPCWEPADAAPAAVPEAACVLLLDAADADRGAARRRALTERMGNPAVVLVAPGEGFTRHDAHTYRLDPASEGSFDALLACLAGDGLAPGHVIHLWQDRLPAAGTGMPGNEAGDDLDRWQHGLDQGIAPMFLLVKKLIQQQSKQRTRQDVTVVSVGPAGDPAHTALSGLAQVATRESPRLRSRIVQHQGQHHGRDAGTDALDLAVAELAAARGGPGCMEVRYEGAVRQVRMLRPAPASRAAGDAAFRDQGIYLITGGAGGIGLRLAEHLARAHRARLVLMGRSPLSPEREQSLAHIAALGGEARYEQGDVAADADVRRAVARAEQAFGGLHGVIHAAGVLEDAFLVNQQLASFTRVLAPKVLGAMHLDQATRHLPLDCFVLFSSVAATLGEVGQSNYATANRFLEALAARRRARVAAGRRAGRTLVVSWPLWAGGGMDIGDTEKEVLWRRTGMAPLTPGAGFAALARALADDRGHVFVFHGDRARIEPFVAARFAGQAEPAAAAAPPPGTATAAGAGQQDRGALLARTEDFLLDVVSRATKLPRERIDPREGLDAVGIDSMLINRLTLTLEDWFGPLSRTLFFEYQTIHDLAEHFVDQHAEVLPRVLGLEDAPGADTPAADGPAEAPAGERADTTAGGPAYGGTGALTTGGASASAGAPPTPAGPVADEPIAIIGVSGRYPGAADLGQLWANLLAARDSVTEIPPERWDHARYFAPDKARPGTSYGKWGGFLDDVDKFDPLLFHIAPRDADLMDPQERLFLEVAWAALEDAGYSRGELARTLGGGGAVPVGVFVGVTSGQYQIIGAEEFAKGNRITPSSSFWSIANRVSYVLDLHGPSLAVDTACSASLTALHLACESIRRGECRAALAGGVNLNIHPAKYVALSQLRFLSSDGRCRAFGDGGDGYVPGEGVGAVLLKPLRQAVDDGDHVYAVIRATTANHGGKTNGYTVPNPNAQAVLIRAALDRAGVDPRTIGYVEAHGTGTSLGDPVEIAGLVKAFGGHGGGPWCAIGSIKSNIGHLESAAGIASLTKVLLMLAHGQLVPSLHAQVLNRNIDFARTPFHVQREPAPWLALAGAAGAGAPLPRRAAISSFGAGGANAHAIVEEYLPAADAALPADAAATELVVLSARSDERLRAGAARLLDAARAARHAGRPALADLAYTLQVGREELESRLAVIAGSMDALIEGLDGFLQGRGHPRVRTGRVAEERDRPLGHGREQRQREIEALLAAGRWDALADLWVQGEPVPWASAPRPRPPRRVSLPSYPFERRRFWVRTTAPVDGPADGPAAQAVHAAGVGPADARRAAAALHPLLDRVLPDLHAAVFEKVLRPDDLLLRDHRVAGRAVLPGVAQLEMARAAGEAVAGPGVWRLRHVTWRVPVIVDREPLAVRVVLRASESGMGFAIETGSGPGARVHATGQLVRDGAAPEVPAIDVAAARARCTRAVDPAGLYARALDEGIAYGPAFRRLTALWCGPGEALGELSWDPADDAADALARAGAATGYVLPPAVTDSALHVLRGLLADDQAGARPMVPFSVAEVTVLGPVPARCLAYARTASLHPGQSMAAFDVAILDPGGRAVVLLHDFCARQLPAELPGAGVPATSGAGAGVPATSGAATAGAAYEVPATSGAAPAEGPEEEEALPGFLYRPCWQERPAPDTGAADPGGPVLIFTHGDDFGLGARLARFHGPARTTLIDLAGPHASAFRPLAGARPGFDPGEPAAWAHALAGAGAGATLYFLGGLQDRYYSANDLEHLERVQDTGLRALLRLGRALAARSGPGTRLRVLTNDVYPVREHDRAFNAFAATLAGFTRTLARELPAHQVDYVDLAKADLDALASDQDWNALLRALAAEPGRAADGEVALRAGCRLVRTVVPAVLPGSEPGDAPALRPGGVCLILGGTGGLGMAVARDLARSHQARLVLVGRRPPDTSTERACHELAALGGEALYLQGDLADPTSVAAVVAHTRARFGAIHGVIHAALVLRDSTVARMDDATLEAVLAPKVRGTVALHQALEAEPLDFLVFFSSSISITAAPGQANYAAASTFEDCFALLLARRMCRPVKIFNWGFWSEAGVVATDAYRERLARRGVDGITTAEGVAVFRQVLAAPVVQIMPMKMRAETRALLGIDASRVLRRLPEPASGHSPAPARSIAARVLARMDEVLAAAAPVPGSEALDALERVARLGLLRAMQGMGVLTRPGDPATAAALGPRLGVRPEHERLLAAVLDILRKAGFVAAAAPDQAPDRACATALVADPAVRHALDGHGLAAEAQAVRDRYPDSAAYLALLDACVTGLPDVLTGRVAATELLFPGGSMARVEPIYRGNRRSDHFNELVCRSVDAFVSERLAAGPERVRVLEVGAGTGGTSARVLEVLAPHGDRLIYEYTDVSRGFVRHGERSFGSRYPFVRFRELDIERDVAGQGFEVGACDLVLATNVLHATRDMAATLRQVKRLLAPGGMVVINEVTEVRDFVTLTFGLTSGWWLFEDGHRRLPHGPLLGLAQWHAALDHAGFHRVRGLGVSGVAAAHAGQHVILAESDGWVEEDRMGDRRIPSAPAPAMAETPAAARAPAPVAMPAPVPAVAAAPDAHLDAAAAPDASLGERATGFLRDLLAEILKMDPAELESGASFDRYGVDSLVTMDVLARLERDLGELPKNLLFDYASLDQLTAYLIRAHGTALARALPGDTRAPALPAHARIAAAPVDAPYAMARAGEAPGSTPANDPAGSPAVVPAPGLAPGDPWAAVRPSSSSSAAAAAQSMTAAGAATFAAGAATFAAGAATFAAAAPIAIVGLSGRYPQAPDLEAFWRNLEAGVQAFSEIPPARWDHADYQDPDGRQPGTTYHRWGAFLDDVDCFDPLLFGIAPREAERMDPQERLFLETAWAALEDAGHTGAGLDAAIRGRGGRGVGVFVGVMYGTYQLLAAAEWARGNRVEAQSAYWSIANRVSYVLDLHGPSLAVDTACSASLTAIHLACESIRRGECGAALAGGVNLALHPGHHVGLSRMRMLSRDGSCRAFGAGADGFVPGEGVGAVLLRPLDQALADGDHVYAVIRGSAVNAGGRTSGYTVPSAAAQAELIEAALAHAGVDPGTISYVEAQAVGSPLGDPIEVEGLGRAFGRALAQGPGAHDRAACAMGSLKPNIGHLEAASGIAQLTKVLLQLQHRRLAPTVGSDTLNPDIDFARTPFQVQTRPAPWLATGDTPRRAGISSFGAGGANAHLIVEEAPAHASSAAMADADEHGTAHLVVLSARKPAQLQASARRLCDLLDRRLAQDPTATPPLRLGDLAYTLQTGRTALAARLAVVASDLRALAAALDVFARTGQAPPGSYAGTAARGEPAGMLGAHDVPAVPHAPDAGHAADLHRMARAWVAGAPVDWTQLHGGRPRRRLPLPTYPFARERYWLAALAPVARTAATEPVAPALAASPLVHQPDSSQPDRPGAAPAAPGPDPQRLTAMDHSTGPHALARDLLAAVQDTVLGIAAEIIKVDPAEIGLDDHLSDLGFDSVSLTELTARLHEGYGVAVSPTVLYGHASIGSFAAFLAEQHREPLARALRPEAGASPTPTPTPTPTPSPNLSPTPSPSPTSSPSPTPHEPIAVIGMSGRFPGSPDLDAFWDNLLAGRDLIAEIPPERFDWREVPGHQAYRWGGFLDDVDAFDALFFNISPREARLMDPQQRLFLETTWKAIEDAGYRPSRLAGTSTGVFVGVASTEYGQLLARHGVDIDGQMATGNTHSILANRVSFLLDLHGPSEPVDTACSSSLVAVHRAVRSIWDGECDMAIAGGVNVLLTPAGFLAFGKSGMLAGDGRCKTFDRRADGYVRGEGVAAILLKPLSRALADGDHVYGVIRGSAVNHGGRATSLTAPNPRAQATLVARAHRNAGFAAGTVGYIEAHGTGTILGDPIEINGLVEAFQDLGDAPAPAQHNYCGLGTVKANIGHLETAAGIAGLVKVLLALRHRKLPPLVHFQELNPHIDLQGTPFYIVSQARDWQPLHDPARGPLPRRAGVSSFGYGGANAHLALEEGPEVRPGAAAEGPEILVFSARDEERLDAYLRAFATMLERLETTPGDSAGRGPRLADMAHTLRIGRDPMEARLAVVASTPGALLAALREVLDQGDDRGKGRSGDSRSGAAVFRGNARKHEDIVALFGEGDEDGQGFFRELGRKGKLRKLAALWAQGFDIDWEQVLPRSDCRRVSLPTYPFARARYWLPRTEAAARPPAPPPAAAAPARPPAPLPASAAPARPPAPRPAAPARRAAMPVRAPAASAPAPRMPAPRSPAPAPARRAAMPVRTPAAPATAVTPAAVAPTSPGPAPSAAAAPRPMPAPAPTPAPPMHEGGARHPGGPEARAAASGNGKADLQDGLRRLFAQFLELAPEAIDPDRPLTEYGVDSIAGLRIMQRIQERFGDDVPMLAIIEHPTLARFTAYLLENHVRDAGHMLAQGADATPAAAAPTAATAADAAPADAPGNGARHDNGVSAWQAPARVEPPAPPAPAPAPVIPARLVALRAEGSGTPLCCVHGDTGELSWLTHLASGAARHLAGGPPILGLEAPGFVDGQPLDANIEDLAAGCADALVHARPAGPLRLAGYGAGAAIAFETARILGTRGRAVEQLVLVAPDMPLAGPGSRRIAALAELVADPALALVCAANALGAAWGATRPLTLDHLGAAGAHADDPGARLQRAAAFLLRHARVPMTRPYLMRWLESATRHYPALARARATYQARPLPAAVSALVVHAEHDHLAPGNPYGLPALAPPAPDAGPGQDLLGAAPTALVLPGDAFTLAAPGSMQGLAGALGLAPAPAPAASRSGARRARPRAPRPVAAPAPQPAPMSRNRHNPLLVSLNKNGALWPSFWTHTLLGDVSYGLHLSHHLGRRHALYGLEQFDMDGNVRLLPTIEQMATAYIAAMREAQPRGPYILGGYSFGGVVAFEMARQIMEAGDQVTDLVLIDAIMPNTEVFAAIDTSALVTDDFAIMALLLIGNTFCNRWHADRYIQIEDITGRDLDYQIDFVARHLCTHGKTEKTPEEMALLVRRNHQTITSNNDALNSYQPRPLPGPVNAIMFHATMGFVGPNNPNNLPQIKILVDDRSNGFQPFVPGALTIIDVPGADHYTICNEEFLAVVMGRLIDGLQGTWLRPAPDTTAGA